MVTRRVYDTMTDREGSRLKVHQDNDGTTYYSYSNGAEIVTRPSGGEVRASDGRLVMKGAKEVVKATGPHRIWSYRKEGKQHG